MKFGKWYIVIESKNLCVGVKPPKDLLDQIDKTRPHRGV